VAHPGDHGSLGPLLNRDAFGSGDCPASNGRGVIGHGTGKQAGEGGVVGVEGQECHHRAEEILDILSLGLVPAAGVSFFALNVPRGGPFAFQFGSNAVDCRCRCPNPEGEDFPAFLFLDGPMVSGSLNPAG